MDNVVIIRARAFVGDIVKWHKCLVDTSGNVLVWDAVAEYYTARHCLTPAAQQLVQEKAAGGK